MKNRRLAKLLEVPPESMLQYFLDLVDDDKRRRRENALRANEIQQQRRAERARQIGEERYRGQQAAKRAKARPSFGGSIAQRMIKAMDPGSWYTADDLVKLIDAPRCARSKVYQVLLRYGLVHRARDPNPLPRVDGVTLVYLYRLTAKGEAEREALLLIGD
jgi:hypothetical protein